MWLIFTWNCLKGRVIISSSLYKFEFLIVRLGFLLFFGMGSIKNMSKYSNLMAEKLELISFFIFELLNLLI